MNKLRNFLRQPRFFLSIVLLPLLAGIGDCPVIFQPLPEPNVSCQTNRPLALFARKCAVVEPLCFATSSWRQGDTFDIIGSAINDTDSLAFNRLELHSNFISSGETFMRRVCQSPYFKENYTGGRANISTLFKTVLAKGFTIRSASPITIT
jgi:hypothetical protein